MHLRPLALLVLGCAAPLAAQNINGQVTDLRNGSPLAGALITLEAAGSARLDSVRTAADGTWSLLLSGIASEDTPELPHTARLHGNYPNPFNPATTISFELPRDGTVRLAVFDALGRLVDERGAHLGAGVHRIAWQARGAAGIYFYTLHFGNQVLRGKMVQLDGGSGTGLGDFSGGGAEPAAAVARKSFGAASYRLIFDSFGYCADTLETALNGGEFIARTLESIHDHALVADLHNDILERMIGNTSYHLLDRHTWWQTDLPRMQEGGIDLQLMAVWVDPSEYPTHPFSAAMAMLDRLEREAALTAGGLRQVGSAGEIGSSASTVDYFIGVEGGHAIEEDLANLYTLYHRGMRMLTITWNNSTSWAASCEDANKYTVGLSDFGRRVIHACDSLGIVIDVAHTGPKTIEDILAITRNPIIDSHTGAYGLRAHKRNLTDAQIKAIAAGGGVIGVVFYPPFIAASGRPATIATVIAHIDYIVHLAGIDHVALGSDFDGVSDNLPSGLGSTADLPNLTLELLKHGYSRAEVEKILGGNVRRVWKTIHP
ncbi:MAG TPA: membrane dipeptidase [bacterium]|nr:membrane dipeptidase [bacterium]